MIVEHRIVQATDVNLGDLINDLISSGALDLGSTSLYVEATAGDINLLPTATLSSITTTGDITLIGGDIKIPAGLTSITAADLSVLASGTIGSAAAAADNAGALTAAFSLTASGALRLAGTVESSMAITLTGANAGAATDQNLSISTMDDIIVGASLNQGTGSLFLTAGSGAGNDGHIDLAGASAITLAGRNVRLTSTEAASAAVTTAGSEVNVAALTITASRNATINAQLRTGNLTITADGELRLASDAAAVLNGAVISLTGGECAARRRECDYDNGDWESGA